MKKFLALSVLALLLSLFAVCVYAADDQKKLYEFNFPTVPWADPVYIAQAKGFFEKYGLKVTFSGFLPNINDIVTNVATGTFPFGCQHASTLAVGISNGFPIRAVAAGWGTSKEKPMASFITLEDSKIKDINDLSGRKVAIPSATEVYWLETKDKFKLKDTEEIVLSYEQMKVALASKRVDAIYSINPFTEETLSNGGYKIIGTLVDVVGEEKGWPQQSVNTNFAEKNPEIVKAYVQALADACDFGRANPDEAGVIIAKALEVDESQGALYNPVFPEHSLIDKADAELWLYLSEKYGLLAKPVTLEQLYTNEFNPYYKNSSQE